MKNKKVLITLFSVIILLVVSITIGFKFFYHKDENKDIKNDFSSSTKITMYYETTENSGDYEEVVKSEWPTSGYEFNSDISYCDNGSTLTWQNNKVVVNAKVKDNCYVYFDKEVFYY